MKPKYQSSIGDDTKIGDDHSKMIYMMIYISIGGEHNFHRRPKNQRPTSQPDKLGASYKKGVTSISTSSRH